MPEGHYSFLLASVSKLPRRSRQVRGVTLRPAEGLADVVFSWPGRSNVLCFTAGARGSKEWQLCPFNLYAPSSSLSPLTPSFEPVVPEIDLFIMIIF